MRTACAFTIELPQSLTAAIATLRAALAVVEWATAASRRVVAYLANGTVSPPVSAA